MTKEALIKHTVEVLHKLPKEKVEAISEIADKILNVNDEITLKELAVLAMKGGAFDFLKDEEDLYTVNDCKVKYK